MNGTNNIFDWMVKLGCMNKADIAEARIRLNESQESKSISAAKKLVMDKFEWDEERADQFIRVELRQDIPMLRDKNAAKFILGVARMYCDNQLKDARTIQQLNNTLKYVANAAHINEYDRNLNNMSAKDLIGRFATNVQKDLDNDKMEVSRQEYQNNGQYNIVRIDSFEQSEQYGQYTSWCVTHQESMFNSYTNGGYSQFYFCLRNDFENVQEQKGENCPLDEYGLSMIAVCVDERGALASCTCRWNHDNGGNDNIMDTKQISQLIGQNFYNVFRPNNAAQEAIQKTQNFLNNAKDIYRQAWSCDTLNDVDNVVILCAERGLPKFIVNAANRQILCPKIFKSFRQVKDDNYYKSFPFIVALETSGCNLFDINKGKLLFEKNVDWFEDFCYDNVNDRLLCIVDDDEAYYELYQITPDVKKLSVLDGTIEENNPSPFGAVADIWHCFYSYSDKGYFFLMVDGRIMSEEEVYEAYADNFYDSDEYYDDDEL